MRLLLNWNDFAILYRTNAQSRIFEETLRRKNIPYKVYGGLSFYERKEIKDVLAYLRALDNKKDKISIKRIEKIGKRKIYDKIINRKERGEREEKQKCFLATFARFAVQIGEQDEQIFGKT